MKDQREKYNKSAKTFRRYKKAVKRMHSGSAASPRSTKPGWKKVKSPFRISIIIWMPENSPSVS